MTGWAAPVNLNHVAEDLKKKRAAPINEFEITHDRNSNTWLVVGDGLERFVQMTNWRYINVCINVFQLLFECLSRDLFFVNL